MSEFKYKKLYRVGKKQSNLKQPTFKKTSDLNGVLMDVALERSGYLEKEDDHEKITQHDIIENVDIYSAQKYFDLNLEKFGPYNINYSRNGRHLLVGGSKGHVAAFDWQTKKLHCEINVMEAIKDIK